ncbi:hypothetical protein Pmani_025316 [Petrolisthes manimaculis]|uniref:Uncharacterized protein n=1 Tax=Petrolisthes manimaculis TaxID=1843537 RepID=A0AAE1TZ20_9EUCA|nr:hypothetical protein Pmani_025316 [Petrolisthes manimaculis]
MSPPPADTYSSPDGVVVGVMVPPQSMHQYPIPVPTVTHWEGEEAMLVVPELSSYAHMGEHGSGGHEVLASLAAMARALPHLAPILTTGHRRTTRRGRCRPRSAHDHT